MSSFGGSRLTMSSEAIEDLTGGVTTELMSSSILDKEKFWQELMSVNNEFLFGCWTGTYSDWLSAQKGEYKEQKGIVQNHAYSIMDAREIDGIRLLRLRYTCIHHSITRSSILLLTSPEILGVKKNGRDRGVMVQNNGLHNGWSV